MMRFSILSPLACALSLATTIGPGNAADRALVVGIDAYLLPEVSQKLTQASSDAKRFQEFLIDTWGFPADGVTLLQNDAATANSIMGAMIDNLVGETAPGDRVVFYFAGMGTRIASVNGTESAILAHDAQTILGKIPSSAVSDLLDILSDRKVSVFIDASFESSFGMAPDGAAVARGVGLGITSESSAAGDTVQAPFGTGTADRAVWNAAAPHQIAWETSKGGVFTSALIDGLKAGKAHANENQTVSNAELLGFIREYSANWCVNTSACAAAGLGLAPHFSGPVQMAASGTENIATPPPDGDIVIRVEDGPVTFQETLGFVTDLFTPSNDANLEISINAEKSLQVGEIVSFSARADRDGTLVLFDINPNGELAQIFPSILSADGTTTITAGIELTIPNGLSQNGQPMQIRVSEPAGQGFLLGLFIEDELPALEAILPANLSGDPISNAGQYLYQIAQELLKLQSGTNGSRAVDWSAAYLTYEITR